MAALSVAGKELIFFTAVCMVLSFGFVTKTALVTHQFWLLPSSTCTAATLPPLSLLCCLARTRVGKKLGGDTAMTGGPSWAQGCYTLHDLLCSRNWGKGVLEQAAVAWGPAGQQSPCDRWWVTAFASLFSSLLKKLSSSQLMNSLTFALHIFHPILLGEEGSWMEGGSSCVVLCCWQGWTHHSWTFFKQWMQF